MTRIDRALAAARTAYGRAHVLAGARAAMLGGAVILLSRALHRTTDTTWLAGAALVVALGVLAWRGGALGRGARAGVLAGLPPMLAPVVVVVVTHGTVRCESCPMMPSLACTLTCFATAALVGLAVGHRAQHDAGPRRFAGAAMATAILTGALGCGSTGLGGAAGIALGLVAGSVTAHAMLARRA